MSVLLILMFVSGLLVVAAIASFVWSVRQGDHEHAERLAVLPLLDEPTPEQFPETTHPAPASVASEQA